MKPASANKRGKRKRNRFAIYKVQLHVLIIVVCRGDDISDFEREVREIQMRYGVQPASNTGSKAQRTQEQIQVQALRQRMGISQTAFLDCSQSDSNEYAFFDFCAYMFR